MSYTNSTPNYGLPQYTADDKPTYLGDFNEAMSKIDTNLKNVDNKATSSVTTAQNANASAEEALQTANSAQSSVSQAITTANQAKQSAENAQTTATNAQSDASSAITTANNANTTAGTANTNANQAKSTAESAQSTAQTAKNTADTINSEIDGWVTSDIKPSSDSTVNVSTMNFNKKLKLLNLFGDCNTGSNPQIRKIVGTLPSNIRPKQDLTVYAGCSLKFQGADWQTRAFKIKTTGEIVMPDLDASSNIEACRWNVMLFTSDNRWNIS